MRTRTVAIVMALVIVVAGVIAVVTTTSGGADVRKIGQTQTGVPEPDGGGVRLEANLYVPEQTPAPAVLLTPGFGGTASSLDSTARQYAQAGYVALAYTPRGFGDSGGKIHFASPSYEVADMRRMVTYLASLDEVRKTGNDPQVAAAGSSYGGGLSLLLAAYDSRVDAVAADITWNNLRNAFFPNFGQSSQPGPFKKLWVGQLFGNGFGSQQRGLGALLGGRQQEREPAGTPTCGRYADDVCRAYQQSAATGTPTAALNTLLAQASPSSVIDRIKVPTQLTQGEQDSLFPLSEADANARGIAANGTPVSVDWRAGGHDNSTSGNGVATGNAISWFDKVFAGDDLLGAQPFDYNVANGSVSDSDDTPVPTTVQADGYPGIDGVRRDTKLFKIAGRSQLIGSPAGGVPAVITSIPGLGGISSRFDQALAVLPSAPGQTAVFLTPKLTDEVSIVGSSTVTITVESANASGATLFAGLRDVADDGTYTLPSQLVSPIRVGGLRPGVPRTVSLRLPSIVQNVPKGHRLALTVSSSDFGYAGPSNARSYTIALGNGALVTSPTVAGEEMSSGTPLAWLWTGIGACVLVGLIVGLIFYRRRQVLKPDASLFDVPVVVNGLVKEYKGGYRAVDDVSFRVEKGQVVGLLGPNGAGKTTALRVLVGLITPTAGELYVFGQRIAPGAPVLSRLGSFIEGPGFLPHLTGRENLRLYWAATGRPDNEAEFAVALDIAGLGGSIDRRVATYSQGMRQRLGIAQAMLGLPELLVLDEPTNGLDPPQIAEMREVMKQYADTGRTVVVSSHLLSEVEQTCTHVVVMHKGRVVSAGSVDEISGTDGAQLSVADPARAAEILAANGVDADLVPARRSLEDVFLELIGEEVDVNG